MLQFISSFEILAKIYFLKKQMTEEKFQGMILQVDIWRIIYEKNYQLFCRKTSAF